MDDVVACLLYYTVVILYMMSSTPEHFCRSWFWGVTVKVLQPPPLHREVGSHRCTVANEDRPTTNMSLLLLLLYSVAQRFLPPTRHLPRHRHHWAITSQSLVPSVGAVAVAVMFYRPFAISPLSPFSKNGVHLLGECLCPSVYMFQCSLAGAIGWNASGPPW